MTNLGKSVHRNLEFGHSLTFVLADGYNLEFYILSTPIRRALPFTEILISRLGRPRSCSADIQHRPCLYGGCGSMDTMGLRRMR